MFSSGPVGPIIVGSMDDAHVRAVVDNLPKNADPLVVDCETLRGLDYVYASRNEHEAGGSADRSVKRGWIRRLAPPAWHRGVPLESHESVVKASWMALLVDYARTSDVEWLSRLDTLISAESKLLQMRHAEDLGLPYPLTLVTNSASLVRDTFSVNVVLKPLGPGHYFDEEPRAVFASLLSVTDERIDLVDSVPFLCQEPLDARLHLRVVTVDSEVWVTQLDASKHAFDWRRDPPAHRGFVRSHCASDIVVDGAAALAKSFNLRYTSQDWVVTEDGPFFLDLNPGGQWLFLPDEVAEKVTRSIAEWLSSAEVD